MKDDPKTSHTAPRSRYMIGGRVSLKIGFPPDLKMKVEIAAAAEGISQNEWIIRAIERSLSEVVDP